MFRFFFSDWWRMVWMLPLGLLADLLISLLGLLADFWIMFLGLLAFFWLWLLGLLVDLLILLLGLPADYWILLLGLLVTYLEETCLQSEIAMPEFQFEPVCTIRFRTLIQVYLR
jgi:hypothetical protein